jgi:hypothetical protein
LRRGRFLPIILLLPFFWSAALPARGAAPVRNAASVRDSGTLDIIVTSPWLALLVNFIGGVNVKASSIQEWN